MASITIVTTEGEEFAFELSQPKLRIGRESDNDIVIPDASMSSHHAEIVETANGYQLTDLDSTNGTQVNGQRIDSSLLGDGDTFVLGHVQGVFVGDAASVASASSAAPPPPARKAEAAPAARSKSPGSFSNSSPFTKKEKEKDPKGQAVLALGILGIIACVAAIALALIMRGS